ncbi:MAG: TetR/AcrR family transcriptional regulator [Ardenticatenaceae bacterium]|nr:TetR/AcrR family transcriptional regulator [Ardenticatenaceae bacterium]
MDSKTKYHHGDLRKALIEAGVSLLQEEDASELTLRRVAREAKVSHMAPYRHFADKNALLAAIAVEGFQILGEQIKEEIHANRSDPRQMIDHVCLAYVKFGIEHPAHLTLMFSGLLSTGSSDELNLAAQKTLSLLKQTVKHAQKENLLKSVDGTQMAKSIWSMVHGLAMLMKEGLLLSEDGAQFEPIVRQSIDHLLNGIKS